MEKRAKLLEVATTLANRQGAVENCAARILPTLVCLPQMFWMEQDLNVVLGRYLKYTLGAPRPSYPPQASGDRTCHEDPFDKVGRVSNSVSRFSRLESGGR